MAGTATFPHPIYARHVLEPGFHEAQRLLFPHMIDASEAHVLMLTETGNLEPLAAAALCGAMEQVRQEGAASFTYQERVEDLFFAIEGRLIAIAGEEVGGNFQIGRSRNDLDAALCRMFLRDHLLQVTALAAQLREVLLDLATIHIDALMPGITHTQPAQPTTLAHFLLGVVGPLERDHQRLLAALDRVNQSPLGVAAFTTTSFSLDRDLLATLTGFAGLVENGYDAVGASDQMLESTSAAVNLVASLSRFVHDLLIWARHEVGVLRVDDAFIQISSIMPQKRNPVVLEHIGVRIGWVYGDATTVATIAHSAAFGDTNDVNDPIYVPLDRTFRATEAVLELLIGVLETATFNVDLLRLRAIDGNTTTTALAEVLVRDHGLSWRTAHTIVSRAVSASLAAGEPISATLVNDISGQVLPDSLAFSDTELCQILDPWQFVLDRTLPGGPAPSTVEAAINTARARLAVDRQATKQREARLTDAATERARRIAALLAAE